MVIEVAIQYYISSIFRREVGQNFFLRRGLHGPKKQRGEGEMLLFVIRCLNFLYVLLILLLMCYEILFDFRYLKYAKSDILGP